MSLLLLPPLRLSPVPPRRLSLLMLPPLSPGRPRWPVAAAAVAATAAAATAKGSVTAAAAAFVAGAVRMGGC